MTTTEKNKIQKSQFKIFPSVLLMIMISSMTWDEQTPAMTELDTRSKYDDLTWSTHVFFYWLVFSGIHMNNNCALALPPKQTGIALNSLTNTHFHEKLCERALQFIAKHVIFDCDNYHMTYHKRCPICTWQSIAPYDIILCHYF